MVAPLFYNTYYGINTNCYDLCNVLLVVCSLFCRGLEVFANGERPMIHDCQWSCVAPKQKEALDETFTMHQVSFLIIGSGTPG